MKNFKTKAIIFFIAFFIGLSSSTNAQKKMTNKEVKETVEKVADLMLNFYVLKEKGEEMSKTLLHNLKKKKYNNLDGGVLANTLVDDLRSITNDKHLMIKHYHKGDASKNYEVDKNEGVEVKPSEMSLKWATNSNYGFKQVSILNGGIGYIKLNSFYDIRNKEASKTAIASMNFLSNSNALIIDLTDNTGGDLDMVQFLLSYFFEGDAVHYNTFHFRDGKDNYVKKYTLPFIPGNKNAKKPLYILIGESTFSAPEAFAYALKHLKRATIIGKTSGGGAHAGDFKLINDFFDMNIPMARAINPITKTNWEGVGVKPDKEIEVFKAKKYAHLMAYKTVLEKETDYNLKAQYEWDIHSLQNELSPINDKEIELKKYVGNYDDDIRVFIEEGKLKYQRGEGKKISTLIPLSKTNFKLNRFDSYRISFDIDITTDKVIGLKLYLRSGQYQPVKKTD